MSGVASSRRAGRVLVVDHRDSFVFTLVDQIARLGNDVRTLRSGISLAEFEAQIDALRPDLILLSPGPGAPEDAGVMVPFLRARRAIPVVGVCLGHQAMGVAFGGEVGPIAPVHGQSGAVRHLGDAAFADIPEVFTAARYHSLRVTSVPEEFVPIAVLAERPEVVMGMRHRTLPYVGVQFHPESILTPFGSQLIANLVSQAAQFSSTVTL